MRTAGESASIAFFEALTLFSLPHKGLGIINARAEQARAFIDTLLAGTKASAKQGSTPEIHAGDDAASAALPDSPSKQETYRLFTEAGLSVVEVAASKAVKPSTVVGYLLDAQANGLPLDLGRLPQLSPACDAALRAATAAVAEEGGDVSSVKQVSLEAPPPHSGQWM